MSFLDQQDIFSRDFIEHSLGGKLKFTEIVSEISKAQWVIGGYNIIIAAAADIEDEICVGDLVEVEAWIDTQGKIYAIEIEETSDDDDFEDEFEITGIVSEIGENFLVVNGLRFEFGPESEFDDDAEDIEVGEWVEIEATMLGDGAIYIEETEVEDDPFDDIKNDDMDDDDDDDDDD